MFERFPFVDVAFGPGQVHRLAEFLTSDSLTAQGYFEFEGFTGRLPAHRERPFQGWVQISVGCNCRCSYCIVPSTRGREVSRPFEELVEEVRAMAADGVREVTLLGQNVNSYSCWRCAHFRGRRPRCTGGRSSATQLRRAAPRARRGRGRRARIRYTSPHPKDMKEDVIRAHAELRTLCEHVHACRCSPARHESSRRCAAPTTVSATSTASR